MRNCKSKFTKIAVLAIAVVCLSFTSALALGPPWTITASVTGSNGTISPTGIDGTIADNATPTYTFAPDANYHVGVVSVDGNPVVVTTPTTYEFPPVTADHTIAVTFSNTWTITVTQTANGTISPDPAVVVNGADQTFTITPAANYHIVSVTTDTGLVTTVIPAEMTHTFSAVAANHTITATFAINTYTITAPASVTNGTLTPTGVTPVNHGANQAYVITPTTPGYHIATLTVDGSLVPAAVGNITHYDYTFTNVTADGHTITATFAINTYTITATTGAHGTVTPSGVTPLNYGGSQLYTITPAANYHVVSVTTDTGSVTPVTPAGMTHQFTAVAANHTITATFAIDTFTISGNAGIAGAALSCTNGTPPTANAGGDGSYSFAVPYNWTGTLTPSKSGYVFYPFIKAFTTGVVANKFWSFNAVVAYTISGNVGIDSATMSYFDSTARTVKADVAANYTIYVPTGWTGTITPSKLRPNSTTAYTFTPDHKDFTNVLANTIYNFNSLISDVEQYLGNGIPREYSLGQNYPNPFNPSTAIEFTLPRSGQVTLEVYDVIGRKVRTLVSEAVTAGTKRVIWDGNNADGATVASGVYFYRIEASNFSETRKMLLLK